MHKKINIVTLGCSKNVVDSEVLSTYLAKNGYNVVFDNEINSAKVAVINTCGFIADAKQESIDTILDFAQAKKDKIIDKLYVMGCLSERYKKEISEEIPQIDGIFGVAQLPQILKTLEIENKTQLHGERLISTPSHFAFLKIAEGCNRSCSFCAIPAIRGKYISQPIEQLVKEAQYLAHQGVKELLIISQDTAFYGYDIYKRFALIDLLKELVKIEGLEWIRLHYLYPTNDIISLVDFIADNPKICKYLDIPFQHISDRILTSMHRGHTKKEILNIIDYIAAKLPQAAIRSTFIVGYPGETSSEFKELLKFVEKAQFDRLGGFLYSEEEGTKAAQLKDSVSIKLKQQRLDAIMKLQEEISYNKNQKKIGQTLKTIIDSKQDDYWIGRSEFDSPEVDNEILIKTTENLEIGRFYNVKITDADEFDIYGEIV